jgi:arylsulfatase
MAKKKAAKGKSVDDTGSASARDRLQRSILPIPDAKYVGLTTYDAKDPDTKFPPIEPLRPPTGAPNVLVILIDDCGFGATSAIGSNIVLISFAGIARGG